MSTQLANGSFYGKAQRPLVLGDVTLAETTYAGNFLVPSHAHAHPIFCLALKGTFTEHTDVERTVLGPRALFFQPAGESHAETFGDTPATMFNIQLGAGWLERMVEYDVRIPDHPHNTGDGRARLALLAAQLHTEYRLGAAAERLAVDGLLLSMLAELTRARASIERGRGPAWLEDVVACLHERYRENLGLTELAAVAGVDPSHLAHTFRARMGCTTGEYVRRLRVEQVRAALTTTDLPLTRIASLAGFADQSHMTRVFRAVAGVTPAEYRRRAR